MVQLRARRTHTHTATNRADTRYLTTHAPRPLPRATRPTLVSRARWRTQYLSTLVSSSVAPETKLPVSGSRHSVWCTGSMRRYLRSHRVVACGVRHGVARWTRHRPLYEHRRARTASLIHCPWGCPSSQSSRGTRSCTRRSRRPLLSAGRTAASTVDVHQQRWRQCVSRRQWQGDASVPHRVGLQYARGSGDAGRVAGF
jgi:hypothetical protein